VAWIDLAGPVAWIDLAGLGGLLTDPTKPILEAALDEELSEHPGESKHDPVARAG
jgi:hypothetical protein